MALCCVFSDSLFTVRLAFFLPLAFVFLKRCFRFSANKKRSDDRTLLEMFDQKQFGQCMLSKPAQ